MEYFKKLSIYDESIQTTTSSETTIMEDTKINSDKIDEFGRRKVKSEPDWILEQLES